MSFEEVKGRLLADNALYLKVFGGVLVLVVLVFASTIYLNSLESISKSKETELTAFSELSKSYQRESSSILRFDRKLRRSAGKSPGELIEEVARDIGLGDSISSFRPIGETTESGYTSSSVEVKLKGIGINELANLVYEIEGHSSLLAIKSFEMKGRFDAPEKIDATMRVALIRKG